MRGVETFNGLGSIAVHTAGSSNAFMQRIARERAAGVALARGGRQSCVSTPAQFARNVFAAPRVFTAPRVTVGRAEAALGGFFDRSYHYLCPEVDSNVDALKGLITEIERVRGASFSHPALASARAYVDRYTGLFGGTSVVGSESCKNVVDAGQSLIAQLNTLSGGTFLENLVGKGPGGSTVAPPLVNVDPAGGATGSILDALGSVKTIAIAGAVIAGVVLVAPLVWRLVK